MCVRPTCETATVGVAAGFGHRIFPWQRDVFADGGYAEPKLQTGLAAHGPWTLEIVKRSDVESDLSVPDW